MYCIALTIVQVWLDGPLYRRSSNSTSPSSPRRLSAPPLLDESPPCHSPPAPLLIIDRTCYLHHEPFSMHQSMLGWGGGRSWDSDTETKLSESIPWLDVSTPWSTWSTPIFVSKIHNQNSPGSILPNKTLRA